MLPTSVSYTKFWPKKKSIQWIINILDYRILCALANVNERILLTKQVLIIILKWQVKEAVCCNWHIRPHPMRPLNNPRSGISILSVRWGEGRWALVNLKFPYILANFCRKLTKKPKKPNKQEKAIHILQKNILEAGYYSRDLL